jgi:hypothetical protein
MLAGLVRLVLFRFFGARVLLVLAALGWLRKRLGRPTPPETVSSTGARYRRRA